MIDKLRIINDDILENTTETDTFNKHMIIKNIMEDEECFFKIRIEYAYAILRDLGIPEKELKYIYMKLTCIN